MDDKKDNDDNNRAYSKIDQVTELEERAATTITVLDPRQQIAALVLAQGGTRHLAADQADVEERTVYRWQYLPEFALEVNRLTYLVAYSEKAERLRFAFRAIRQSIDEETGKITTRRDALDWLRYVREEMGSIDIDHLLTMLSNENLHPPTLD